MQTWGAPKPSPEYEHNHIDGNKLNCHVSNLEWVTPVQNINHAIALGLRRNYGERHKNAKFTELEIIEIRRRRANGEQLKTIANDFHTSTSMISIIANRRGWKHI
jgi:hypothetical protein